MMFLRILICLICLSTVEGLTDREREQVGQLIWRNECGGTLEGLTSWNRQEAFASMGIGHFIWYPAGGKEPYQETFPQLMSFLQAKGVTLPIWLKDCPHCPWRNREAFYRDFSSSRMKELRSFLSSTVSWQCEFMIERFEKTVEILGRDPGVKRQYLRLTKSTVGVFALIDYINFKGVGTSEKERYQGKGWGVLQVLQNMRKAHKDPLIDFVISAKEVLRQRIANAPGEKDEVRWIVGWENRLNTYLALDFIKTS